MKNENCFNCKSFEHHFGILESSYKRKRNLAFRNGYVVGCMSGVVVATLAVALAFVLI